MELGNALAPPNVAPHIYASAEQEHERLRWETQKST
jgi:hypothetical protein